MGGKPSRREKWEEIDDLEHQSTEISDLESKDTYMEEWMRPRKAIEDEAYKLRGFP